MTDEFTHDLQAALRSRPVIEQAKGVLVALRGSTADQAFAELQYVSQRHIIKLRTLASGLVDAASGMASSDPRIQEVLLAEWGRFLTRHIRRQPLNVSRPSPSPLNTLPRTSTAQRE